MAICNKKRTRHALYLKIRLKYFEKDENIALNCNYKQIYKKIALEMPNL